MALVCAQCSRVNPADAVYCFHDGAALTGRGGPVNAGSAPFPNQFVFPGGQSCRNFDQLAMTCQQNWRAAGDLLKQGFLYSFFGGMGRIDLAMAAQEAAKFPDQDRGLDQLLEKLPTQALQQPKVKAEPSDISLGQVKVGVDRATEVHLSNLGMRLLYGSVVSDSKWLTVGDAPGQPQKFFQFHNDVAIPIHIKGQHLRAGTKPLEGKLLVESNGGSFTVTVRADVPVTPYPGGLFAGAVTPRQIAEKAKANPKDAAPSFENGAVAQWYVSNGWLYPVQGPTMPGTGAIQQFFEALGVAKAPKVEINLQAISLQGAVGDVLNANLEVSSQERKVVYAWAVSDQDWITFGATKLVGRTATVPVTIRVPGLGSKLVETKIQVVGNGGQKFTVPLKINVTGGNLDADVVAVAAIDDDVPTLLALDDDNPFAISSAPPPVPTPRAPPPPVPTPRAPERRPEPEPVLLTTDEDESSLEVEWSKSPRSNKPGKLTAPTGRSPWPHLVPLGLLLSAVVGLFVHDLFFSRAGGGGGGTETGADTEPRIGILFDHGPGDKKLPVSGLNRLTFGVVKWDGPPGKASSSYSKLTFDERGQKNRTVLLIDDRPKVFGKLPEGKWSVPAYDVKGRKFAKSGTFAYQAENIFVTQEVSLEKGEPIQVAPEKYEAVYDTCLVKYRIENRGKQPHKVGLRFLLDTYIGTNDGVPFTLPGEKELVSTFKKFDDPTQVPGFIQVLENPDLKNPGLIAQLNLRISDKIEPPGEVRLTRWQQEKLDVWDVPLLDMQRDSSVVMYWQPAVLEPGRERVVGFTYGLGQVEVGPEAMLGVTANGEKYVGGEITVVALVADPKATGVKLDYDKSKFTLAKETPDSQPVPASKEGKASPITWRLRATAEGPAFLAVTTEGGQAVTRRVRVVITRNSLF